MIALFSSQRDRIEEPVELLAPAGSFAMLKAVIAAGADAVYIGGSRFGARAYADNPDEETLLAGLDYAHLRGVKVYLTVNTLLKNDELAEVADFVRPYVMRGLDGVLVQDFGVLSALHREYPSLPLHISTQMTVTGPEGAAYLKRFGVTRVVPAREMSLEELRAIRDESGLEVEAFIHGALCYCYSGQCLLSSMIGGRSGNRGRCAQPCRLPYEANGKSGALLSPKDLCTIDHLPGILAAGVTSLKIEGRMKQPSYAAGVTAIYRKYLDRALDTTRPYRVEEADRAALESLFNREGHTDGYLTRHNGPEMMAFGDSSGHAAPDAALGAWIKETFIDHEKKIPVTGAALFREGEAACLTLRTDSGTEVTVFGNDPIQRALKQPMTGERIAQQLKKSGGTDFEITDIQVSADESIFVPVGALNELRRSGLEALREQCLIPYRRMADEAAAEEKPSVYRLSDVAAKPAITASCETDGQFAALLEESSVGLIYYPLELLCDRTGSKASDAKAQREKILQKAKDVAGAVHQKEGREVYLAMPYIDRRDPGSPLTAVRPEDIEEAVLETGFDGFLVRSLETLARLARKGLAERCRLDTGLYAWNDKAAAFLRDLGAAAITAPAELNKKELFRNAGLYDEIVVYGRQPLMISAQCIRKNTDRCLQKTEALYMADRTSRQFYVKNVCAFCYNVIYNSLPLCLIDEGEALERMKIPARRYAFTDETPQEIRELLGGETAILKKPHTKGHFGRGVE